MRGSLLSAVLFTLVFAASSLSAGRSRITQQFVQRAWGTADGLPQSSITSIVQTRDGYLWLGTWGGLVRFDGLRFTVFGPENSPGLLSSRIVTLHEDRQGVLWIGTETGLARYERGRFTEYTPREGLPRDVVFSIAEDERGELWVGTGHSLARRAGSRFVEVPLPWGRRAPLTIAATPASELWIGTWDGLIRFRDGVATAHSLRADGLFNDTAYRILVDRAGRLWVGGEELAWWDGARFVKVPLPGGMARHGAILALAEDKHGALWIGTRRGGLLRRRDGEIDVYAAQDGLSHQHVRSLLADREGNLWIGTDVGGLNRLRPRRAFAYQRSGGKGEESIVPVVDDGAGGLWLGGTCGWLLHFRGGGFGVHDAKQGVHHDCIWSLHRDADGALWIGTAGRGLARLKEGRILTFHKEDGFPATNINAIYRDRGGALWLGTEMGVSRYQNGAFTNYGAAEGLRHGGVSSILEDRGGALWLGTPSGLVRFKEGRFTSYTQAQGLSHDHVRDMHEDEDGVLWIGTYGGGLNRLENGRFTRYGSKAGLHDSVVNRIIEDDSGNLWMSGNRGVFRAARRELNAFARGEQGTILCVSYDTADGMPANDTNGGGQPAGWRTSDGKLWFPTIKGLVAIDPSVRNDRPPPVFIERVVWGGRDVDPGRHAAFAPGKGDVEFHYTALELGAAEKARFKYRLDGYDESWIDAGTRRAAYYTNVAPGRHTFRVIAMNADGAWNEAGAAFAFTLAPPFHKTFPFYAACALGLVAAGSAGHRLRTAQLARRAQARVAELEREQALSRERSRIARDLHDDLGSRLAHIALMADASGSLADRSQISSAAREAIHTMGELVWAVSARNDTVLSLAHYVGQFAEKHVHAAGLRCRVRIQPELDDQQLGAETRRHLYLAFKEAVTNAVKHAQATEIRVGVSLENGALVLDVADDGLGFQAAAIQTTGNGLKNMRERMQAADGTFHVDSAPGRGTRLVLRVPLEP